MKGLYKMNVDYWYGNITGLFIADTSKIDFLINNPIGVYFGEVLGKYSEVEFQFNAEDLVLITSDEQIIKMVEDNDLEVGYNPLKQRIADCETDIWKYKDDGTDVNGDFIDKWCNYDNYDVETFIDYLMTGKLPEDF